MKYLPYLFFISLFFISNAWTNEYNYSPDRLIIKMISGQALPKHKNIKKVMHLFDQSYVLYTDNLPSLEKHLQNHPSIVYVEKDYQADKRQLEKPEAQSPYIMKNHQQGPFNDPLIEKIWLFKDAEQHGVSVSKSYLQFPNPSREEIIVAVVDTGVDYNHEDLKNNMWVNKNEIAGNGIDDDNNGYVDDIHGINTLIRDSQGNATVEVKDRHGHGTHVSGTIGAVQNNNLGIAGIASKVKIMALRTVPNWGDEKDVDVIEAFIYAAKNGAKIINCSFGKRHNEGGRTVAEAIDHIGTNYGVLVVAASGNSSQNIDQTPSYPASFDNENLLVVASTDRWGGWSRFSNYGVVNVDVAAPGAGVYSTIPNNRYTYMTGTSMASPTTAGVAAEVLSQNSHLSVVELKNIIIDSVVPKSTFTDKILSGGRVDLYQALVLAQSY